MLARLAALTIALALTSVALNAHAQEDAPPPPVIVVKNPLAGTVLTSVGGSMLLGSPLVVLAGAAIAEAGGPYNTAALGPVVLGAFASACIGLGMLIPGVVMLATHKRAPHHVGATWATWTF